MKRISVALMAMMVTTQAWAIPTGEISIVGLFAPSGGDSLGNASGISFSGNSLVVGASGSFADYLTPFVSQASINSFEFDPFESPVDPLWTAGGFSFRLDSIAVVMQNDDYLALSGNGVLNGNGFENTAGTWDFLGSGSGIFMFRTDETVVINGLAGGIPVAVPDGGNTCLLLGILLMGLVVPMRVMSKRLAA